MAGPTHAPQGASARRTGARGMTTLRVAGVPADVEVRASTRRRRSVTAFREDGRVVVVVPARMPRHQIAAYVDDLVGRLERRETRAQPSDAALARRAGELSRAYLDGRPRPTSVRWVTNQHSRWGSTTPAHGTIRLSARLASMPSYVVDAVLVHELAHLLVPGHGADFRTWERRYPRWAEAQAFLAGWEHAAALGGAPVPPCPAGSGADDEIDLRPPADAPVRAADTLW